MPNRISKWGLDFPIEFPNCPNCDSDKRLAYVVGKGLKSDMRMSDNINPLLFQRHSNFSDPRKPGLSQPIVTTTYDVCAECGTVWVVRIDYAEAIQQAPQPSPETRNRFKAN